MRPSPNMSLFPLQAALSTWNMDGSGNTLDKHVGFFKDMLFLDNNMGQGLGVRNIKQLILQKPFQRNSFFGLHMTKVLTPRSACTFTAPPYFSASWRLYLKPS